MYTSPDSAAISLCDVKQINPLFWPEVSQDVKEGVTLFFSESLFLLLSMSELDHC